MIERLPHSVTRPIAGDLLLVGVGQGLHRGHRGAADRVAGGNQQSQSGPDAHQAGKYLDPEEGRHDHDDDGHRTDNAKVADLIDGQPETEQDHAGAQQALRRRSAPERTPVAAARGWQR